VVGGILAWNMPVMVFAFKVIPALLAGNTIIAKPSPYTPVATLALAAHFAKALPPGVLNVVAGGDALGQWIVEHPGIDKISFTGSSATGKRIVRGAAATMKRVSLELGGNDAAIVLPDADIGGLVEKLFWGAFRNTGQICVAVKRVYAHEDVYDELRDALIDYARGVKIGGGMDEGTQLGPLQNKMQHERVKALLEDCRNNGHRLHSVGEVPSGDGYFLPITFVDDPPEESRIVAEEQFGPVLPLLKFQDAEDAVARANSSRYGLTGSVWSADAERAAALARRLQCGTVWVNTIHDSPVASPTAGHKESGLGTENGMPGLLEYTNLQTTTIRTPAAA
jgi:aldehyde dehydrogenase (NAD+)